VVIIKFITIDVGEYYKKIDAELFTKPFLGKTSGNKSM
jgi:hypothetical protein